ncbi:hypothetical protein ARMSODRAFT_1022235 [Armillaria solidipes]|uniref:Uncharacterized protein n=1 Tax=Armillaria solidipes TaxID=1076256 RepID=A0A2H3BQR7_9AGAR|nr:hypothetical protein ARMSODRAFT_1022234 [Armillaria solidipes]PBK65426.1 hypothetical protein ARMSODRAFT_1022235 [Armillaria solidipes]
MLGKAEALVKRQRQRFFRKQATGDTNAGRGRQPTANSDHGHALQSSHQALTMNTVDPSSRRERGQRNYIDTAVRFPVAQGMMDIDTTLNNQKPSETMCNEEVKELRKELGLAEEKIVSLEGEMAARDKDLIRLHADLEREQAVRKDERRLLDVRTQELQDAHAYSMRSDTLSTDELVAKVESLNAEIYQVSAYMADSMTFGARVDFEAVRAEAVHWFGSYIIDLLCSTINEEMRMQVVQVAMQAALVQSCADFISMWHVERRTDENLSRLYAKIQATNTQVVAGRWRAMTRSGSKYESLSDVKKEWIKTVVRKLAIVLIFAGWTGVGTNPPWEASTSFLMKIYGERIEEIIHLAMDLDRGMGEGIVSEDIVIFSVGGGSSFVPDTMENGDGEFTVLDSDRVLCTCELGLKVSRSVQKDGYSAILVKPKVVLCSTMSDIIPKV